jgi:hypothetical protein
MQNTINQSTNQLVNQKSMQASKQANQRKVLGRSNRLISFIAI